MAIPKVSKQSITNAMKYIDENGVPFHHQSTKYELVDENNNRYPPKYVVAVARHLENGAEISTGDYSAVEAKNFLERQGFMIETKEQVKYELVITADMIESTDERFTIDNISLGDNYRPLDVFLKKGSGEIIRRNYVKGERKNTNQTMPKIALQAFEKEISSLSVEDKENFPICRYSPTSPIIRGIFNSVENFKKSRRTIEYLKYRYGDGRMFVIYCWNIFSTIFFVQECLKRFGDQGDQMVLTYRDKDEKETSDVSSDTTEEKEQNQGFKGYRNLFSNELLESKNIIFHGAPGTGKTHLAKEIATDIVSNGYYDDYNLLTDEQKKQIEFVQFHPSYDYTDFVEGLRPKVSDDGSMGFELQDGIFKRFVTRARRNYEDSQKSKETIEKEMSVQESMMDFFSSIEFGTDTLKTINGNEFTITSIDDEHIYISIPGNATVNKLTLNLSEVRRMLESGQKFDMIKDVTAFFGKTFATQGYSYDFAIFKAISARKSASSKMKARQEEMKKYIFIIDEINRGEISKIFGELFFAIDPGYRGKRGEISTQYSNLHSDPNDKFYIPDNVYIIGTMNDIDRSVDSFDFAMRRHFRFLELKADERLEMLDALENEELKEEAINRMASLNKEIANTEDLNENYQIGASYFLKLKHMGFDQLWTDYLQPLLQDYVQGLYDEKEIMKRFAKAYGYQSQVGEGVNEDTPDQG